MMRASRLRPDPQPSPSFPTFTLTPIQARQAAHAAGIASHLGGKPLLQWVDMVAWACDDSLCFTSESLRKPTQSNPCVSSCIRVWSAPAGRASGPLSTLHPPQLLHTLQPTAANQVVYVLQPHPHNSHVLASAGYDGVIRLWDALSGSERLTLDVSTSEEAALIAPAPGDPEGWALLDASWCADAIILAASPSDGFLPSNTSH